MRQLRPLLGVGSHLFVEPRKTALRQASDQYSQSQVLGGTGPNGMQSGCTAARHRDARATARDHGAGSPL
jgi:hypothetical protein